MTCEKTISKQTDWKSYLEEFSKKVSELFGDLEFEEQLYQADWEDLARVFKEGANIIRGVQLFCRRICFQRKSDTCAVFLSQLTALLRSIYFHSDYYCNNMMYLKLCYLNNSL